MNRRDFCRSVVALPGVISPLSLLASGKNPTRVAAARLGPGNEARFVLQDRLEHPFYWWPRTLLRYPVELDPKTDRSRLVLTRMDTGERIPVQWSDVAHNEGGLIRATLNFFADLPSGARREFVLSAAEKPIQHPPQVRERREGNTVVIDSGVFQIRIPASPKIHGEAPGPILQVSRGGAWFGTSTLRFSGDRVTRLATRRVADGPLFLAYELHYETEHGSHYVARVQCEGGFEFVRFEENMEGVRPGTHGVFTSTWSDLGITHRQAPNHPFPLSDTVRNYEDYDWERIGGIFKLKPQQLPEGELPFTLGVYERAPGNFQTGTFANFWSGHSGDALGVFIHDVEGWQDHEYAYEVESPTLQVRYHFVDGEFYWKWPLVHGRRSTCIAFYDHAKDKEAMRLLEQDFKAVQQDGISYAVPLTFTSHVLFLQNRYGTLDLNRVKDWVLEYPASARRPASILGKGRSTEPDELERRVMTSPFICTLPVTGTRQMAGHGPIPGRNIVNFSPVPSRQVAGWVEGFNQCSAALTDRQRRRLTAMFLVLAYVQGGDEFMPLVNLLSGHPNFLADVKATPPAMAFLFPDHPKASAWADMWEKCVELNTRFNTRPAVKAWNALGGRWTENLGTYVWAFLGPSLRTEFLLRQFDGRERFLSTQLAEMADWLVNALSAPFNGESEAGFRNLTAVDYGREWGVVPPGGGPRRLHPPQGAHSEQRFPPRSLWYFGTCLRRYAPLAAEHAMWASRPTDPNAEEAPGRKGPPDIMYLTPDNRGTNPHLRSAKFTGYGVVLRAGVDTPDELSIHLQQIDEGPNYRWGRCGEGGCGVLYFYAGGKSYSYTGPEDVGDRDDQDTDFCTTFGIYKNGQFRSIGMNVLARPLYDLGTGQFAEIVPREGSTAYSTPEYVSRSVLLAGREYFVLYDSLAHQALTHRLTWSVRKGDELPNIQLLRGASGHRETQRTEVTSASTTGVWFDGLGDSLAVVSHRKDLKAEGTPFGCRVNLPGIQDLVFRNPEPIQFAEGDISFEGTAGLIRTTGTTTEFSLFHGSRIGVRGLIFATEDPNLGIGGVVSEGRSPCGEYFAPTASGLRITAPRLSEHTSFYVDGPGGSGILPLTGVPRLSEHTSFYVDGAPCAGQRESGMIRFELKAGRHHWELTDTLPVPNAPRILRTETIAGGARVIVEPVAAATQYQLELSKDGGTTWTKVELQSGSELAVGGLHDGEKVHVRALALNALHSSAPGADYPIYATNQPPPPPDGLRVGLTDGAATITWGEILGASEYRLYARLRSEGEFRLLYRGIDRSHIDRRHFIRACNPIPGQSGESAKETVIEYYVTAADGNGESTRSYPADTDPASWRNWDPRPGERFRRVTSFANDSPPSTSEWPRYYPE